MKMGRERNSRRRENEMNAASICKAGPKGGEIIPESEGHFNGWKTVALRGWAGVGIL